MSSETGVKPIVEWGTTSHFKKLGGLTGKQKREFNAASLCPGTYGLVVFSPETVPRPGNRNIVNISLKAHSICGRELFFEKFDLVLKKHPLIEFEFQIDEKDAPATATLTLHANNVKVGIDIAANISKITPDVFFDSTANLEELCVMVQKNVSISSPQLAAARSKRIARPFLYLASLHPQTRGMIASSLEMKVPAGLTVNEECEYLLIHPKKGLCDRNKSLGSKMTKSASAGNWQALVLGTLEENCLINPAEYAFATMGDQMEERDMHSLEVDATLKLALRSQEVIKEQKVPGEEVIDQLCQSPLIKEKVFENLNKGGFSDPIIHRFTLELVLRLRETSSKKDKEKEKEVKEFKKYTPEEVLILLKERVFSPVSGTMLGNETKKVAKKAGTVAAKIGFNQFVLMAIIPPLGFAFLGYNIANAIFGESMNVVSAVVLQLLAQKLLLAAQGIYIPQP